MCPHTRISVLTLLHVCPHTTKYVSSYYHMCPHTTIYVSSPYYMCPHSPRPQAEEARGCAKKKKSFCRACDSLSPIKSKAWTCMPACVYVNKKKCAPLISKHISGYHVYLASSHCHTCPHNSHTCPHTTNNTTYLSSYWYTNGGRLTYADVC